jgi:hypothetical protein
MKSMSSGMWRRIVRYITKISKELPQVSGSKGKPRKWLANTMRNAVCGLLPAWLALQRRSGTMPLRNVGELLLSFTESHFRRQYCSRYFLVGIMVRPHLNLNIRWQREEKNVKNFDGETSYESSHFEDKNVMDLQYGTYFWVTCCENIKWMTLSLFYIFIYLMMLPIYRLHNVE